MIREIFIPYGEGRYLRASGHYCRINTDSITYKIGVLPRDISKVKEVLEEIPGVKIEIDRGSPFSYIYVHIPHNIFPLFHGRCNNCGEIQIVFPYVISTGSVEMYCANCAPRCNSCERTIPHYYQSLAENEDHYVYEFNHEFYCAGCVPRCSSCGSILDDSDSWFYIDDDYFCASCAGTCHYCGEAYLVNELCSECGCCHNCCQCVDGDEIMSYSYKPDPIFHRLNYENPFYLGVELEVEGNTSHDQSDIIKTVREELNLSSDICYFKYDSSLGSKGVEVVFHPTTLRYFTKVIKITNVLKELKKVALSYNTGRCGIHIHIPKSTLTTTEKRKLVCFTSKCKKYLIKFSKRKLSQIEKWCRFYDGNAYKLDESLWKSSRYHVVNFCPSRTIEFRLFRGTLYSPRFLAFLRFVVALVDYVKSVGIAHIALNDDDQVWRDFVGFVKNRYPHLYQFFKEDGLAI